MSYFLKQDLILTAVSFIFIIVTLIFSAAVFYYFYQNGLKNNESIDILYPCIGAMILTLFLGFKTVVLDNTPKTQDFDLAILHFIETGNLRSLPKVDSSDIPSTFKAMQNHLYLMDDILKKYPNIQSQFRTALGRIEPGQNLKLLPEIQKTISEIVEWQFLERLFGLGGALDPWNKPILGVNSPVTVFSPWKKIIGTSLNIDTENQFLKNTENLLVNLPANIKVSRIEAQPEAPYYKESARGFVIKGNYTTMSIRFSIAGIENFLEKDRIPVYANQGDQEIIYYRFYIEIISSPFTRFSERAKAERKWMEDFLNNTKEYSDWNSVRDIWIQK